METAIYIVFHPSTAVDLRRALRDLGRDDEVIARFDNLSYGPLVPGDFRSRDTWFGDVLGFEELEIDEEEAAFWKAAFRDRPRIVWTSRRDTREYAGFLDWVWRAGARPYDVIDLTDAPTPDGLIPPSIYAAEFSELGLFNLATPLADTERAAYAAAWERLRAENAPLRVIEQGALVSAPLDYFDDLLLANVTKDWRRLAHAAYAVLFNDGGTPFRQTCDFVPVSRLGALVEAGAIEARGDLTNSRACYIRLPDQRA